MIEFPESQTLAWQLRETVLGKRVEHVIAAASPHGFAFYAGDPANYPLLLEGKTVTAVHAFGGYVEITLEEVCLSLFDGINLRYLAQDAALPKKHQLYLGFADGTGLVCTVQMYGGMLAYPANTREDAYYLVAKEKPAPLENAFDERYFDSIVKAAPKKASAKALLATEQRIPGLGNGCAQDILYRAGVNPQSKLSALSDNVLERLFQSVKTVLEEMTAGGGRNVEKDLFGRPGGYPTLLSNKTLSFPCVGCGGGLVRKAYMGGNVYFCPHCQPVLK